MQYPLPSPPTAELIESTNRFVKADQAKLLIDEYDRLGRPMTHCTLVELIQKTEIELSKNHTFKLLTLSDSAAAYY